MKTNNEIVQSSTTPVYLEDEGWYKLRVESIERKPSFKHGTMQIIANLIDVDSGYRHTEYMALQAFEKNPVTGKNKVDKEGNRIVDYAKAEEMYMNKTQYILGAMTGLPDGTPYFMKYEDVKPVLYKGNYHRVLYPLQSMSDAQRKAYSKGVEAHCKNKGIEYNPKSVVCLDDLIGNEFIALMEPAANRPLKITKAHDVVNGSVYI